MVDVPVNYQILIVTVVLLYIGSHASTGEDIVDEQTGKSTGTTSKRTHIETMQTGDAAMFPIMGSCALFGLYLCFKFVDQDKFMMILKIYFGVASVIAQFTALRFILAILTDGISALNRTRFWIGEDAMCNGYIPYPTFSTVRAYNHYPVTLADMLCLAISITLGAMWFYTPNDTKINEWCNILAFGLSIAAVSGVRVGSFTNSFILLWGLFVYDVFWVFGTNVMVTVAKKIEGPVKIAFPISEKDTSSILGLGDIVLPGFLISLLLRFDIDYKTRQLYFWLAMLLYTGALQLCIWCMTYFDHAQPALLYLVPALTIPIPMVAWINGDWDDLYNYEEGDEGDAGTEASKVDNGEALLSTDQSALPSQSVQQEKPKDQAKPEKNKSQ